MGIVSISTHVWIATTAVAFSTAACDSTASSGDGAAACGNVPSTSGTVGMLPARPGGPAPDGTGSVVFAISKLYYGDTDRSGNTSRGAWTTYGLNIDGKTTSAQSTDVCTLAEGASRCAQLDGQNGIDNSFGENLLPIFITTVGSKFSVAANNDITQGGPTTLIALDQLGAGPTYDPLRGAMYRAAPSMTPPRWDGSDIRNVNSASLAGDGGAPLLSFPNGYLTQGTWVAEPPSGPGLADLSLRIVPGFVPPVLVTNVQVALTLGPTGNTASGVLSGVVPTASFVAWFKLIAGHVSTSLCSGSAFASIAQQIEQAADIMLDGTNEPGEVCNGISIGVGFDAVAVQMGPDVTVPPVVDPCADAGADGPSE